MDTFVNGLFPRYKLAEYARSGICLEISEEDRLTLLKGKIDFLGLNYYSSSVSPSVVQKEESAVGSVFAGITNPYLEASDWGWKIDPVALRLILNQLDRRYHGIPMMITENGLGAVDKLEADGQVMETAADLSAVVQSHKLGETVHLKVQKYGSGSVIEVDAALVESLEEG